MAEQSIADTLPACGPAEDGYQVVGSSPAASSMKESDGPERLGYL